MARPWIKLEGRRHGKLVIKGRVSTYEVLCQCDCGEECIVDYKNLQNGGRQHCGCERENDLNKRYIGMIQGKLTVIAVNKAKTVGKVKRRTFTCRCTCGTVLEVRTDAFKNGNTSSCGCYKRIMPNNITHGESKSELYKIWESMMVRARNKLVAVHDYDPGFESFEYFRDTVGKNYQQGYGLRRINNNIGYYIDNIYWYCYNKKRK